jgi:ABC-type sugar transport system ATPase subunit
MRRERQEVFLELEDTQTRIALKKDVGLDFRSEQELTIGIRPEHIHICGEPSPSRLSGRIGAIEPLGRELLLHVQTKAGPLLVLNADKHLKVGDSAAIGFDSERFHLFERRSNETGTKKFA